MRYELEVLIYHARQPRTRQIAAIALPLALLAASMSTNYAPLTDQLHHRYLESQGRAPEQIAQQEEAAQTFRDQQESNQRATEQARAQMMAQAAAQERARQAALQQQQQAQQQQNAQAQSHAAEQNEIKNLYNARFAVFSNLHARLLADNHIGSEADIYSDWLRKQIKAPGFWINGGLTIEETATDRACRNPQSLRSSDDVTAHNLYACAVYYAQQESPTNYRGEEKTMAITAYGRKADSEGPKYLPIDKLIEYIWDDEIQSQLSTGDLSVLKIPPLVEGNSFNPDLILRLNKSFASQLMASASFEEKQHIANVSYPHIVALVNAYLALADVCRKTTHFCYYRWL